MVPTPTVSRRVCVAGRARGARHSGSAVDHRVVPPMNTAAVGRFSGRSKGLSGTGGYHLPSLQILTELTSPPTGRDAT